VEEAAQYARARSPASLEYPGPSGVKHFVCPAPLTRQGARCDWQQNRCNQAVCCNAGDGRVDACLSKPRVPAALSSRLIRGPSLPDALLYCRLA
jgi:hypothetical protein